jgi:hypothetical protein
VLQRKSNPQQSCSSWVSLLLEAEVSCRRDRLATDDSQSSGR